MDALRRLVILIVYYTLLSCGVLALHLSLAEYAEDDAYIHVRVAEHLLRYGLPYFNPTDPVAASSSPVWTLVLAAVQSLGLIGMQPIAALNSILLVASIFLLAQLTRATFEIRTFRSHGVATLIILSTTLIPSVGLMETPLAILLAIGTMFSFVKVRRLPVMCAGLAPFVRPEFIILPLLVACSAVPKSRAALRIKLWWMAASALPVLLYQYIFFGSVLPHTAFAKRIVYSLSSWDTTTLFITQYLYGLPTLLGSPSLWGIFFLTVVAIIVVASVFLILHGSIVKSAISPAVYVAAACLALGGSILGAYIEQHTLIFPWYVPLYLFPLGYGCYLACSSTKNKGYLFCVVVASLPLLYNLALNSVGVALNKAVYYSFLSGARARQYEAVAARLNHTYPNATLLAPEIGAIGKGFAGEVIDACGLATPEALKYHPLEIPKDRDNGKICGVPPQLVAAMQPDIIVSYGIFLKAFTHSEEIKKYSFVTVPVFTQQDIKISGEDEIWGESKLYIFFKTATIPHPQL